MPFDDLTAGALRAAVQQMCTNEGHGAEAAHSGRAAQAEAAEQRCGPGRHAGEGG